MNVDPDLGKLARFTPAPAGIDRDELLFRAGKASARVGRGWKAAVLVLLVTQCFTLTAWLGAPGSRSDFGPPSTGEVAGAKPTNTAAEPFAPCCAIGRMACRRCRGRTRSPIHRNARCRRRRCYATNYSTDSQIFSIYGARECVQRRC